MVPGFRLSVRRGVGPSAPGLRGWEFCNICQFFANFSTFTKIPQVPSFQAHSSRENRFPPEPKKRPKIAKPTKHEPLPKRDAISRKFPEERELRESFLRLDVSFIFLTSESGRQHKTANSLFFVSFFNNGLGVLLVIFVKISLLNIFFCAASVQ